MDSLLPSEIARLVLGYLQEQKCEEAAKAFMETSPQLQECRTVAQRGGRIPTKVGGLCLTEILDKYCAATAMIQEKLSKVGDSEQLKHCNDILDQLSYLLEGSRKRFVVNINYSSTQGSPAGQFTTPNSGSAKKRHGNSESRNKRVARSLDTLIDKSSQSPANPDCDIDNGTAPLDGLSSQKPLMEHVAGLENERFRNDQSSKVTGISSIKENTSISTSLNVNSDANIEVTSSNNVHSNCKDQATETVQTNDAAVNANKCTAGTSTEELMNYCSTEVQTGSDFFDAEPEDPNLDLMTEPIQNVSFITKEIISTEEFTQRIAENINKANLTLECEDEANMNSSELNQSKLTDIIQSAVKATESDLEGILKELFGGNEYETQANKNPEEKSPTPMDVDHDDKEEVQDVPPESEQKDEQELVDGTEVPIKQRLRSSSKCFSGDGEEKDSAALLDDQNAEAVMSIINVISNKRNSMSDTEPVAEISADKLEANKQTVGNSCISIEEPAPKAVTAESAPPKTKKPKKPRVKRQPQKKSSATKRTKKPEVLPLDEGVPTIVFLPSQTSPFVPIAPKPGESSPSPPPDSPPTIAYRVVNVPRHLVKPEQIELSKLIDKKTHEYQALQSEETSVLPIVVAKGDDGKSMETAAAKIATAKNNTPVESITLYGASENDGNKEVTTIADMPIINIDSSTIIGTGLSPFFKDAIAAPEVQQKEQEPRVDAETKVTETNNVEVEEEVVEKESASKALASDKLEIIVKRTPNTLLNSRRKNNNNRLSLSTPRRRNSHVRALDFDTPAKQQQGSIAKKLAQTCVKPKVCRGGLFKSPTYDNDDDVNKDPVDCSSKTETATVGTRKVRTLAPVDSSTQLALMQVPIATRSPAPKLCGAWNKLAGIGSILVESSTGDSSPEKSQQGCPTPPTPSPVKSTEQQQPPPQSPQQVAIVPKKSWDSDLRKIVGSSADEGEEGKTRPRSKRKDSRRLEKSREDVTANDRKKAENDKSQKTPNEQKVAASPSASRLRNTIQIRIITPASTSKKTDTKPTPDTAAVDKPSSSGIIASNLLDLETPRKIETTNCVPPTPQVFATPAHGLRKSDHRGKADVMIKDIVETPDFPVTPRIVNTPKIVEDDPEKRPSPYYEPDEGEVKAIIVTDFSVKETTVVTSVVKKNVVELHEHKSMEITQFGVFEKSQVASPKKLPEKKSLEEEEEEAEAEDNSHDTSKESLDDNEINTSANSFSNSDDESSSSSSSNSSTSSSSSNSSSSDSSRCSSANSTPAKCPPSVTKDNKETAESSPQKVFPINKNPADEVPKETPAKDENAEVVIFETPSVSEAERAQRRDSITNFNFTSQMSAAVATPSQTVSPSTSPADLAPAGTSVPERSATRDVISNAKPPAEEQQQQRSSKPKIIKIEKIAATDGMAIQVSKLLQSEIAKGPVSTMRQQGNLDGKMGNQLEEKRLRVMAKFKGGLANKPAVQPKRQIDESKKAIAAKKEKTASSITNNNDGPGKKQSSERITEEKVAIKRQERETSIVKEEKTMMVTRSSRQVQPKVESKDESKENKRGKGRSSPRKRAIDKKVEERESNVEASRNKKPEVKEPVATANEAKIESTKGSFKAKVDLVKRDLFSDDEQNSEQRTTRSQATRRTAAAATALRVEEPRNDYDNEDENWSNDEHNNSSNLLESLQLIPANKSKELESHEISENDLSETEETGIILNTSGQHFEVSYRWDESIPIKKRRRSYSSPELKSKYIFYGILEDEEEPVTLSLTPFEEFFNMDSEPRVKNKKPSSPKKSPPAAAKTATSKKTKNVKQPLAASSPLVASSSSSSGGNGKVTEEERKRKPCKRKASDEEKTADGKHKPDPRALLKRVKIDELLKVLHPNEKKT